MFTSFLLHHINMYRPSSSGENIYLAVYLKFNSVCVTIYELLLCLTTMLDFHKCFSVATDGIYTHGLEIKIKIKKT